MNTKAYILALLVILATLSGCNMANGPNSSAIQQIGGEKNKAAGEQQDVSQVALSAEQLRLSNERAKLAEERAELEKQKRELAEELLKQAENANVNSSSGDSSASESVTYSAPATNRPRQQYASHHSQITESYVWLRWECSGPPPAIGEVVEDEEGVQYQVVGRRGNCLKAIALDEN